MEHEINKLYFSGIYEQNVIVDLDTVAHIIEHTYTTSDIFCNKTTEFCGFLVRTQIIILNTYFFEQLIISFFDIITMLCKIKI